MQVVPSTTVPQDCWICHECEALNHIGTAPGRCPACGHYRCQYCPGPGSKLSGPNGFAPGRNELHDSEATPSIPLPSNAYPTLRFEPTTSMDASFAPAIHSRAIAYRQARELFHGALSGTFDNYADTGIPIRKAVNTPPDAWYCPDCKAANSGNTPDFCPICGWKKPT